MPLHPAVVHIPIAIGLLIPFLALVIFIGIKKEFFTSKTWVLVVLLQMIVVVSSVVALRTGENEEHTVEKVINEEIIEKHEDLGKKVPIASGVILIVTILGLIKNQKFATAAQIASLLGMLGTAVLVYQAGHSGGELVYKHNAASAYQQQKTQQSPHHND